MWFYAVDGAQHGPVGFEPLLAALSRFPDPAAVHVWRDGMPAWQVAGRVSDIARRLAPPLPRTPVAAPIAAPPPAVHDVVAEYCEVPAPVVLAVARYYQRLILLVAAQIVVLWAMKEPVFDGPPHLQMIAIILMVLVVLAFGIPLAVTVHALMSRIDERVPVLWATVMFLPLANLAALWVISSKAQAWFGRLGIHVGLVGPTKQSLDAFRRG